MDRKLLRKCISFILSLVMALSGLSGTYPVTAEAAGTLKSLPASAYKLNVHKSSGAARLLGGNATGLTGDYQRRPILQRNRETNVTEKTNCSQQTSLSTMVGNMVKYYSYEEKEEIIDKIGDKEWIGIVGEKGETSEFTISMGEAKYVDPTDGKIHTLDVYINGEINAEEDYPGYVLLTETSTTEGTGSCFCSVRMVNVEGLKLRYDFKEDGKAYKIKTSFAIDDIDEEQAWGIDYDMAWLRNDTELERHRIGLSESSADENRVDGFEGPDEANDASLQTDYEEASKFVAWVAVSGSSLKMIYRQDHYSTDTDGKEEHPAWAYFGFFAVDGNMAPPSASSPAKEVDKAEINILDSSETITYTVTQPYNEYQLNKDGSDIGTITFTDQIDTCLAIDSVKITKNGSTVSEDKYSLSTSENKIVAKVDGDVLSSTAGIITMTVKTHIKADAKTLKEHGHIYSKDSLASEIAKTYKHNDIDGGTSTRNKYSNKDDISSAAAGKKVMGMIPNTAKVKLGNWPETDADYVGTIWDLTVADRTDPVKTVSKTNLTDPDETWKYTVTQGIPADTYPYTFMQDFTFTDQVDSTMEIIDGEGGVKIKIGDTDATKQKGYPQWIPLFCILNIQQVVC